jgi:hypothetical protein
MKSDEEILESLILGGFIGGTIGALISSNKGEGATLGAIAGAAIVATYKATEKAKESNIPMYIEENGSLFMVQSGKKEFVKKLVKPSVKLEKRFKLE